MFRFLLPLLLFLTAHPAVASIAPPTGAPTQHLYDGDAIHAEYPAWSQPNTLYADGQDVDEPLAKLPLTSGQFDAALYYQTDAQGSVNGVTRQDAAADTAAVIGYDPWGAILRAAGNFAPPTTGYGWQGRERDETGLMYFRARYYDPTAVSGLTPVGRFVSRDPMGFAGGLNPYAAFENDPVNNADPTGTTAISSGLQGLISQNNSYYNQVSQQLGFDSFKSSNQSMATVNWRPSVYQQSTTAKVQTALNLASMIPVVGAPFALASAAIDADAGHYASAGLGVASVIPFLGTVRGVGKTADVLLDVGRVGRSFWKNSTEFGGIKVYQRDDLINPSFMDVKGRTNLQRMERGIAPIGPDGESLNLHHMLQSQNGPIAEMTQTFHQKNTSVIHINPSTVPSGIDRGAFGAWRGDYWRSRAADFK